MITMLYQLHALWVGVTLVMLTLVYFELFFWTKWSVGLSILGLAIIHYYIGNVELKWIGTVLILWGCLRINYAIGFWQIKLLQLLVLVGIYIAISQMGYALLNYMLPTYVSRSPLRFFVAVNLFDCLLLGIGYMIMKRRIGLLEIPTWLVLGGCVVALYLVPPLRYSRIISANIALDSVVLYQLLAASALLILLLTLGVSYRTRQKLKKQAEAQLIQYAQDIEELYDNVAMFRHDYLNILHSLQLSIDQENWQEVTRIFRDTVAPTQKLLLDQSFEFGKLGRVGALELKSLLHTKLVFAQSKGLTIQLDIPQSVPDIIFDKVALVRAVAILLDNAIEAAIESDEKKLLIALFAVGGIQHIHVINSSSIKEWAYQPKSTIKRATQTHGWGLYYLHQLVQRDARVQLMTDVSAGFVRQQLIIDMSDTLVHPTVK